MGSFEPGSGLVTTLQAGDATTIFRSLGPMPAGLFLRRLWIDWQVQAAHTFRVGLTIGRVAGESQQAFEAGATVVQRSFRRIGQVPALEIQSLGELAGRWVLNVGVRFDSGPNYVVWALQTVDIITTTIVVSAETVRFASRGKMDDGDG